MITQVSLPSIFTQTYPLDYNGYNTGIKDRPKSIIELFKQKGYQTMFIAGHDISGPIRNYERGAEIIKSIYQFEDTIEKYIRLNLYFEIKNLMKKISKTEIIKILQKNFTKF